MVHVRRATVGGLKLENTHPFSRGPYSYCHNGTILHPRRAARAARRPRAASATTDSERFFKLLMTMLDPDDVVGSLRAHRRGGLRALPLLGAQLPLLRRAPAVRLPARPLRAVLARAQPRPRRRHPHPPPPPPRAPAAASTSCWSRARSSPTTSPGQRFEQDELLICDPADPDHPRIERLLGERADEIEFVPLDRRRT